MYVKQTKFNKNETDIGEPWFVTIWTYFLVKS